MSALPNVRMTEAEYLAFDRASDIKHEYYRGEVFAMSGGSPEHNMICASVGATLYAQLRGRSCKTFSSDQRIKIPHTRLCTYADFTVTGDQPAFTEGDTLLNPTLLIEVLSPSTELYDRGRKFQHYRTIDSLREYVLIAQDQPRIERYLRQDDGTWLHTGAG